MEDFTGHGAGKRHTRSVPAPVVRPRPRERGGNRRALHSQGEEIYWRYGENTPSRSRIMAEIMGASSGYTVADPEGMASHGGFKDWFISEFCRPGFTVEFGLGENPLPVEDFESIYEKTREMLLLAALM